ncbi:hypothetical protein FB451DRAFT_1278354 [Mycena latifolia]|nr:hypothetical protein FB451DRAFT_1278354 [Mycena latifolia]
MKLFSFLSSLILATVVSSTSSSLCEPGEKATIFWEEAHDVAGQNLTLTSFTCPSFNAPTTLSVETRQTIPSICVLMGLANPFTSISCDQVNSNPPDVLDCSLLTSALVSSNMIFTLAPGAAVQGTLPFPNTCRYLLTNLDLINSYQGCGGGFGVAADKIWSPCAPIRVSGVGTSPIKPGVEAFQVRVLHA